MPAGGRLHVVDTFIKKEMPFVRYGLPVINERRHTFGQKQPLPLIKSNEPSIKWLQIPMVEIPTYLSQPCKNLLLGCHNLRLAPKCLCVDGSPDLGKSGVESQMRGSRQDRGEGATGKHF